MRSECCQSNEQHPLIVKTAHYQMMFSATGKLISFLDSRGAEQLKAGDPGRAFHLLLNMQTEIPLCELEFLDGNILKCSSANRTQSVHWLVTPRERYCHFKLVRLEGIPAENVLTMHFGLNSERRVKAFDTDYMTFVLNRGGADNAGVEHAHENALVTRSVFDNDVQVLCEFIWNRDKGNPLGSFALYTAASEDEEDDIILEIWANETLPHPRVEGAWTHGRARAWVAEWHRRFAQRNQMMIEGDSLEELYEGAEYARRAGCNEVYLFTNSWRNKGFWPMEELNWALRPDIYKNGERDLREFSDHLARHNMRLNIHYVSGGFGLKDPQYAVNPDERLASYGAFSLAGAIGEADTTILVKPQGGTQCPYVVDDSRAYIRLPGLYKVHGFHYIRIGREIVRAGDFLDTDKEVWTLANCRRGVNGVISAHGVEEPVRGLIDTYNINLIPDNDSTLLAEVAEQFAGLVNRCRLSHVEYDGAEIHNYNGNWGYQKFTSLVYGKLDHPVTAHDSGAAQPKCHIEYRLNATRKLMEGNCSYSHGNYSIPFTLHTNSRLAVNKLESHYTLSQGYKGGAMGLAKPEPMFGVRPKNLKAHGQIEDLLAILRTWREVAAHLTPEQRKIVERNFTHLPPRYERSHHLASEQVLVAREEDGKLKLVPTTILTREKGDILWQHGQEHGPIAPKQFVRLGDSLQLRNPHARQTPRFLIRLAQGYDYDAETRSAFEFQKMAGEAGERAHLFVAGNVADTGAEDLGIGCNMRLDPRQDDFSGSSLTSVSVEAGGYVFEARNPVASDYYEAYKLPAFPCRVNMIGHRGLGMTIEGDGSGALFIVQIAGRDYVTLIDFKGERYVEILNGEVAWHDGNWGWRMATKSTRYSGVKGFKMGFCHIPPGAHARIRVSQIKLLREIKVPLKELTIRNSLGSITVRADILTGDYIEYEGEDVATVYDANFNKKQVVNVGKKAFEARTGGDTFTFVGDGKAWIEVQLYTEGEAIGVNR